MAPSRALIRHLSLRSLPQSSRSGLSSRCFSSLSTSTLSTRRARPAANSNISHRRERATTFAGYLHISGTVEHYRTLTSTARQQNTPSEESSHMTDGEKQVFNKLTAELQPTRLEVQDVSGGCGSMYAIEVASKKFEGLSIVKQHRLVNSILAAEIKEWHGLQLRTAVG